MVIGTGAGMEHINRGTIGKPDILLIVSDSGARGLRTISRIREIATQLGLESAKIPIVFNKFKTGTAPVEFGNETTIGILPEDPGVEPADLAATPVSQIPPDSPARIVVRDLAEKIRSIA